MSPTKLNLKIYQGSTFKEVIRWESTAKAYAPITGITKAAPIVITSTGHTIPVGWRVKVTNVLGMKEINSADTYQVVSEVSTNTLTFNDINSLAYTDYLSGGVLEYNIPNSLVGASAKMQIRGKITDTGFIDELTTLNGKIVIDNTLKTITILLADTATAAYSFASAVYSLEITTALGEVIQLINGSISLDKEITR